MLRYATITSPDINNGLGCRATIWISGCSRQCQGCHNKELWLYKNGKTIDKAYSELKTIMDKPYINGLTISGGDPLDQTESSLDELSEFISRFKKDYPKKDIWIYSGGLFEDFIDDKTIKGILKMCDILVDGPYEYKKRNITLPFRGSENQRIIDLKKTFESGKIIEKEME